MQLEDDYTDVLNKAQKGLGLHMAAMAHASGLDEEEIEALKKGRVNAPAMRKLAPVLQLDADAWIALAEKQWAPHPHTPPAGLFRFVSTYGSLAVNAYLVADFENRKAIAFDSGTDATGILDTLKAHQLELPAILITHCHGDHIMDADRLAEKTGAQIFAPEKEPLDGAVPIPEGWRMELGTLQVEARLTNGHSAGGISYLVHGLDRPLAIVGDALFAGSMGGPLVSYAACIETNLKNLFTLSDDTLVCPGHGPYSTIGEEKKHNPFFVGRLRV